MDQVARALRRIGIIRAITALVVGGYLFSDHAAAVPAVARASAAYWVVDGIVTLRAARYAEALAVGRMVFLLRGAIAIGAGLIVLGLPLRMVFGAYQPGQGLLFIPVAAVMLAAIGCQIGAVAFDVLIGLALRRRLVSPWSWAVGSALSVVLALVVASIFVAPATSVGRVAGIAAIAAALGLVIAVLIGGERGTAPVLSAHSRKP